MSEAEEHLGAPERVEIRKVWQSRNLANARETESSGSSARPQLGHAADDIETRYPSLGYSLDSITGIMSSAVVDAHLSRVTAFAG